MTIPGKQALVLIVDDKPEARQLLAHILEEGGYRILEAENGQQAIDAYLQHHPDLILMDLAMPVMDGIEACLRIRQLSIRYLTSIIIVTAHDEEEAIIRAFNAGATDYLIKPIHPSILFFRIERWLYAHRVEQELARRNHLLQQLDRVMQAATSTLDLPQMLKQIIHVCAEELNATSAYISDANLEDKTTTVLVDYFSPSASPPEMSSDEGKVYSLSDTFPTTLRWLENPTPYLLIHTDDPNLSEAEHRHYQEEGAASVLMVPIYAQGPRLWGYLEFWESRYRRDFSEDEIALAQEIARRIGASIHNARVYTSLKASEAELRHYAAKLEALNSDLDAYAYTIAHDLKSPLHMIMNYTELVAEIERDHMGAESREFLAKVQHHGARMAEMIDQLLALARIGDAAEVLDEVELKPVIDSVIERFEISLQEHHFHIEVEGALPTVKGNVAWLREVFANLVSNAIKYRDEGKDRHFITISVRPHGQKQVRCFVQDNGIGIPPNFVPKLFEMFARVDKHRSGGLGLGLSIVKRLVHKMGGEVGVESTFGEGTTFWFTLPLPEPES